MHPCTEFGVASSKFTFTGGPRVKTSSSPLARAAGNPQKRHPQRILSWYSMRVTREFGVGGLTRAPLRAARKLCVQNTFTCTARALRTPAHFFIRRQVGLAKVHPCTEFGVVSSKFTFTRGPHVKTASSPLARAAGTPQKRHHQWILSWYSTRVTYEFGFSDSPRLTSRGARNFLVDLHAAARATCHVPPADPRPALWSFWRFGASIGATPVPIGPAVRALFTKVLGHTY